MAKDGDRHQLGDPISRIAADGGTAQGALTDDTDPARLTDTELRRQLANLDEIVREAPARGTPPDVVGRAEARHRELTAEYHRRTGTSAR